eukprot:4975528-Prymnesium_polylepis.1
MGTQRASPGVNAIQLGSEATVALRRATVSCAGIAGCLLSLMASEAVGLELAAAAAEAAARSILLPEK